MALQNTPVTITLGDGANIRLTNIIINTGNTEATIQFGSIDFPTIVAQGQTARPQSVEACACPACHVQQYLKRPAETVTPIAAGAPQKKPSVFEMLGHSETPIMKRVVTGRTISLVPQNNTTLPAEPFAPRRHDAEASSSESKFSRRQRRKRSLELRAQ